LIEQGKSTSEISKLTGLSSSSIGRIRRGERDYIISQQTVKKTTDEYVSPKVVTRGKTELDNGTVKIITNLGTVYLDNLELSNADKAYYTMLAKKEEAEITNSDEIKNLYIALTKYFNS